MGRPDNLSAPPRRRGRRCHLARRCGCDCATSLPRPRLSGKIFDVADLTLFSSKPYDRAGFDGANGSADASLEINYFDIRLTEQTASLAAGSSAVCAFVNDDLSEPVLRALVDSGVTIVALRCAGFNNVDLDAASRLGITLVRVPSYSPNAVAEHTLALMLGLNRHIHRAHNRVRDANFSLDGLVGFDMAGKTAAVIGTGKIGAIVARLLWHLRCDVLAVDPFEDEHLLNLGVPYVTLDEALTKADIVTLNCPLIDQTHHLINANALDQMKRGAMLVNTGRGALIDTTAVVDALKSGHLGSLALDVYEEEGDLFFEDRSDEIIDDDVFARLLTFPNVLITAHQGFLTREALSAIAETTLANVRTVLAGQPCDNVIA
jgi:D-lactate dehydrogenase